MPNYNCPPHAPGCGRRMGAMAMALALVSFLVLLTSTSSVHAEEANKHVAIRDSVLLISTLDGSLHAVGQRSGLIKWSITDVPILQMSPIANLSEDAKHLLLPDPKDGSLYLFNGFNNNEKKQKTLEKLPFTISELVSTSPCRSSDGMIYTSKKSDEWIVVDIVTGAKVDIISVDSPMCPTRPSPDHLPKAFESRNYNQRELLYLFKSEYQISVFNAESREKLSNLTYVDYSSSIISSIPQKAYDFYHFTSSTNGKLVTLDTSNGANNFLWSQQFSSPIVAMYKLTEGPTFPLINRIPFLTIGGFINITNFLQRNSLFPSVYVGELAESKSLYALSALVDYNEIRKDSDYLIEGPKENELEDINGLYLSGYYEYPKLTVDIKFGIIKNSELISSVVAPVSKENEINVIPPIKNTTAEDIDTFTSMLKYLYILLICLIILIIVVPTTIAYIFFYKKSPLSTNLTTGKSITIGKISYNPSDIIGRGCAGTCVYKGLFENRQQVAVKRIVADCFQLANREIELLRRLHHPQLIRYFATEHDHQFLYIAIELAELTLAEYIEKKHELVDYEFNKTDILYQSCQGLAHLHSLNIVHRDIKPANILISLPMSPNKTRKIMITDFGVSKILNSESLTTEFSAGTEGWIAPEILKSKVHGISVKASKPNDIFSMGCLIYYTYTDGGHPFGNLLHRQSNIMNGSSDLSAITDEEHINVFSLVEAMIALEPEERPPIEAVVKHPFFWNSKQSLQFLQDISDRIESEKMEDSSILKAIEFGSLDVCKGDWRHHLSYELQEDLRKFRNYRSSLRDLLRAIRNKRHHYHELDERLQNSLGSIPHEFSIYFTSKFPRLIPHTYIALQVCRREATFQQYYHFNREQLDTDAINDYFFKKLPKSSIRWFEKINEERANENQPPSLPSFFTRSPKMRNNKKYSNNNNNKNREKANDKDLDFVNHGKLD